MSELTVGQLRGLPINNNVITVPSGHKLYASGSVVQVISKTSSTSYSNGVTGNTTFYDFPNNELRIEITPKFSTSNLLLMASVTVGGTTSNSLSVRFTKNGSPIGVGSANGSRPVATSYTGYLTGGDANHTAQTVPMNFLDSPATSSLITYNIQGCAESSTLQWNRTPNYPNSNVVYGATFISSFTIMEIAQ
jgi:hypothetical protein